MILRITVLMVVLGVSTALGEPVTLERIRELPRQEQTPWVKYVKASRANARTDAKALQEEVSALGLVLPLRAPEGGDFKLPANSRDPWYATEEASRLADTILSYQTPTGGWSKHTAYGKGPRQRAMQWTSQNEPGHSPHYVATFDNRSTTEQLQFLANLWHATRREDCRAGFVRGLNFLFAAQYPNGGWPQVYPLEGDYHDDVTFNDDAMTHILELLLAVGQLEPQFEFLDDGERQQAAVALDAGLDCVMATQFVQDGRPTAWCAQYDALTLRPSQARALEPPALSGIESAQILKFLMTIRRPSTAMVHSIEDGLSWLNVTKISGLARINRNGKTVYESNPDSSEVYWARFYDLNSGKPVFPGRDGILYESFAEMAAHNALGYDYYSTRPGSIVTNGQKKWRKMLAKQADETEAKAATRK